MGFKPGLSHSKWWVLSSLHPTVWRVNDLGTPVFVWGKLRFDAFMYDRQNMELSSSPTMGGFCVEVHM